MPLRYIEGDLFEHEYDPNRCTVIAHVCNDQGVMGSGFVVPLAKTFPWAKEAYVNWFKDNPVQYNAQVLGKAGPAGRGQTQLVLVQNDPNVVVANMVAQTLSGERPLYYNDLVRCMEQVANSSEISAGGEIICPMFGSALAGGNWKFIVELITDCWLVRGIQVTVYYLERFLDEDMLNYIESQKKQS